VAWLLAHQLEVPRPCSYLEGETAQLEHLLLRDVDPRELDALLGRGWRRFGPDYFRPACAACQACEPLRIPVATFKARRSQRKAANRCRRFRREVGRPVADADRLALYGKWHASREAARDWEPASLKLEDYALTFCGEETTAREITWWDDAVEGAPRLVAVGHIDVTPEALSAIYFFYDPEIAHLSPGTANVIFTVEDAAEQGLGYVYLGFRVRACASLKYKGAFGPHEVLEGRPELRTVPRWRVGAEGEEE
jgi:arginyl-tRNA--protein-N-Asp/Glu arginylyltransferase